MQPEAIPPSPRRGFLMRMVTVVLSTAALLPPIAAGLAVLLDPLRPRGAKSSQKMFRVATLEAIPDDGTPRRFPVIADSSDAWTLAPQQRIGAVYLRRLPGEQNVVAFNAVCPHAGCFVGFDSKDERFECPCHASAFSLDGQVLAPSPSPRDLDRLDTEVTEEGVVMVAFQNFYTGRAKKIAKS